MSKRSEKAIHREGIKMVTKHEMSLNLLKSIMNALKNNETAFANHAGQKLKKD